MKRISDSDFLNFLRRHVSRQEDRFRVGLIMTVAQHTFTISDQCCRMVIWQTAVGFEYRVLSRQDKRMLGFGQCPLLRQAFDEALALMSIYESRAFQRTA